MSMCYKNLLHVMECAINKNSRKLILRPLRIDCKLTLHGLRIRYYSVQKDKQIKSPIYTHGQLKILPICANSHFNWIVEIATFQDQQ